MRGQHEFGKHLFERRYGFLLDTRCAAAFMQHQRAKRVGGCKHALHIAFAARGTTYEFGFLECILDQGPGPPLGFAQQGMSLARRLDVCGTDQDRVCHADFRYALDRIEHVEPPCER